MKKYHVALLENDRWTLANANPMSIEGAREFGKTFQPHEIKVLKEVDDEVTVFSGDNTPKRELDYQLTV